MKSRNGFKVMTGLIGMIRPLLGFMILAILMGTIGNLMAIFITILGGYAMGSVLGMSESPLPVVFGILGIFAVLRGVLRYAEQACNHYIAFRILARIRYQVFASLRRLAPAKLEGSQKGNLISIITSDIELLEVFYAHTISPIAIAVLTSGVMIVFTGRLHWILGMLAAVFYGVIGIVIPVVNSKSGQGYGQEYREKYGQLNTVVLDNLYGLDEIVQYHQQKQRLERMEVKTEQLEEINRKLKGYEKKQRIQTDSVIAAAGILTLLACGMLAAKGSLETEEALLAVIAVMSSFGPTAALAALSNNLNQTLASGNRVLDLLEEKPLVEDIVNGVKVPMGNITAKHVDFSYHEADRQEQVLKNFSIQFEHNKIHGILGKSGCGKSTLLKLMMRFFETEQGSISYGTAQVNEIDTSALRNHIAYVTQETFLFEDTIENNIKVADYSATREEVEEAAKKASIHEFIMSLPEGYDTKLKELGNSVSGGERQRIGIARAFLHKAGVILLDEPTSNIDSLNEGIILKSLKEECRDKTIVLVSHRTSTMGIADQITRMEA